MRLCRTQIVLSVLFLGLTFGCGGETTPAEDPGQACEADGDCVPATACQTGTCDSDSLECVYTINDNSCLVDGNCHLGGSTPEDDLCKVCDPATDNATLQAVTCSEGEVCDSEQGCVPAEDTCGGDHANCVNENPCMVGTCGADGLCTFASDEGATCDDSDACTTGDACRADGSCTGTFDNDECICDEVHPCPEQACQTVTCEEADCVYVNMDEGTECDDANVCTTKDRCKEGTCNGTTVTLEGCGDACNEGECVPDCDEDGVCETKCETKPVADGKPCDDGSKCTAEDHCEAGACTSKWDYKVCECQDAAECNDKMGDAPQCQQWACEGDPNESTKCAPEPGADGGVCDDGDACTENDTCQAGKCAPGNTLECEDTLNPCTDLKCNPAKGCQEINLDASTTCSDGLYCTTGDHCDGKGACVGGGPTLCSGSINPCIVPACDEDTDSCTTTDAADGTTCETGDVCVTEATCKSGDCTADAFKECTTDNPCMTIACDSDQNKGCVETPVAKGTHCGDEQTCTGEKSLTYADKCNSKGQCITGKTTICPGGNTCGADGECFDFCGGLALVGGITACAQPYFCDYNAPGSLMFYGSCKCENKTWETTSAGETSQTFEWKESSFSHCSGSNGQTFTPSYDSELKSVSVRLKRATPCGCVNALNATIADCGNDWGDLTMKIYKVKSCAQFEFNCKSGVPTGNALSSISPSDLTDTAVTAQSSAP